MAKTAMDEFGLPTTLAKVREGNFVALYFTAFMRGLTLDSLCRCYAARANATGEKPQWRDFLLAVQRGEFDYLLFDHDQSLS
jgi:hypothetical protein